MPDSIEIVNPNKHLEIPKWINENYFKNVLDKDEPNHVKVLKFTPVAAIPPGENFTSVMLRIYIDLKMKDGSTKSKSYVFKTMLPDDKGGKQISELGFFPKERIMYETYLPAFEALYKEAGENIQIAPKCLHIEERDGNIHFIFEDLRVKKFQNVDRIIGLDMIHTELSMRKLAELHAASAVYAEKHGPYPELFEYGFVTPGSKEFIDKLSIKLKGSTLKESMRSWGIKDVDKYMKNFPTAEQFWKQSLSSCGADPNEFNVLIHGDFWSSNLMFSYLPDGGIDEVIILDHQLGKLGSPAQDLLFFLILSVDRKILFKEYDTFIEIYHTRLIECLRLLKYRKRLPELREIHMAMYKKNNSFYAFFAVLNHLPVILFPSDKDSNIHLLSAETEEGDKLRQRLFSNPAYTKAMRDMYPFFYKRGIFHFTDYD